MKIGLIDVDGHGYPNLPLMKISAWHKGNGDSVEWYEPMFSGHLDKVYMSKVFSFTPDYEYYVDADEVIMGGSGYCIKIENGMEVYHKELEIDLPPEIEHIYPDYSIYPEETKDTAFGFLSRGCPRGCKFCCVAQKDGQRSRKTADLSEFWSGQKNIVLFDPNITACPEWKDLFNQLIESKATINFNQGIDIRTMTEEKAEMLKMMKIKTIHFAWDRYEDGEKVVPRLELFKNVTGFGRWKVVVYVLTNFGSTHEQDLERIYKIKEIGFTPNVMIYRKDSLPQGHITRRLQRYVNSPQIFWSDNCKTFDEYKRKENGTDK